MGGALIGAVAFALRLAECAAIEVGEPGIAVFDARLHFGQIDALRERQRLSIQLGTTDHHQFAIEMRSQYVVKCVKNARARRGKVWVARQHPVVALRQRPAERIPGLAAHEYRVASGDALELDRKSTRLNSSH